MLFQQRLTIDAISACLGLDRKTVRRYARAATAEALMCERASRTSALTEATRLARSFAAILRRRDGNRLGDWLAQADESQVKEIRAFANGIRKDLAAVTAGLALPLNSGAVEGNVTRIKLLKRQHYGRAGFDLLRRRILLAH